MIEFKDVSFSYEANGSKSGASGETVLNGFSCNIDKGDIIALMGESGSGKTTVLRLLAGLERPRSGSIIRDSGPRISVVFQDNRLFPWYTVKENVLLVSDSSNESRALELLDRLGIACYAEKYPSELSGGQQRRVAIARALCFGGDLLLLDEPFTGFDFALRERTARLILESFDTILLATHDKAEAELLGCNRFILV